MTTATVGSFMSLFASLLINLMLTKGSTLPPQDFLLYMPEHFWASSCDWSALADLALFACTGAYQSHIDGCYRCNCRQQQQAGRPP